MIKRNAERSTEVRKNMRGGEGEVKISHYFKPEEITAPCRLCAELVLAPGSSIGLHEHSGEDEVYIIQRGKGIITMSGKETEVSPGDAILTGRGASHSIRNTGNEDLVITAVIMLYPKA